MVIKPVRSGRVVLNGRESLIYTTEVDRNGIDELSGSLKGPAIYQEKLDKRYDIRVTVIGSRVFATEIHCRDYRRYNDRLEEGGRY